MSQNYGTPNTLNYPKPKLHKSPKTEANSNYKRKTIPNSQDPYGLDEFWFW
jgi:hypothetical protein